MKSYNISMGRKSQYKMHNIRNMLTQETFVRGSPQTKSKLLYKVAGFLAQSNSMKHMNNALEYYNKIYDLMNTSYGEYHPRTLNALMKIAILEKRITVCKQRVKEAKIKRKELQEALLKK